MTSMPELCRHAGLAADQYRMTMPWRLQRRAATEQELSDRIDQNEAVSVIVTWFTVAAPPEVAPELYRV